MAVDKYKAYQMCVAMGNPPAECAKKYNTPTKKTSSSTEPEKKDKKNNGFYM